LSDKVFVSFDSVTLESLHAKLPPANSSVFSPPPPLYLDVYKASFSFPSGSAGGLDGLRPQYLKYMLCTQNGAAGAQLLKSVTELVNAMLSGAIPLEMCPILFGANPSALKKKDGGIRPIAIGNVFRRLASKLCNTMRISKVPIEKNSLLLVKEGVIRGNM